MNITTQLVFLAVGAVAIWTLLLTRSVGIGSNELPDRSNDPQYQEAAELLGNGGED